MYEYSLRGKRRLVFTERAREHAKEGGLLDPLVCARPRNFSLHPNRVFSLTWPVSMQIYWNKRKRLHKKRVQLPEVWFGTPTWPPFHCFGTPIWPPWRHVKTLLNKPFPSLCSKTRLSAQPLMWKWFFILMQIKLIFTRKVAHFTSFWKWGFMELGNGLLK